jgi:hypothetical protein
MDDIEEAGRHKETRKFYRKVTVIRKGYKPRIGTCKDKMRNLVTGERKILQRWTKHFVELLNGHGDEKGSKGDGKSELENMDEYLGKEEENGTN